MATYEITGPDGKKYRITGETPEGAFAALQQHLGAAKQPDQRDSVMGRVDSAMRGLADTLSFGTADEIAAQVRSGPMSVQQKPEEYYRSGIFAGEYNPLGVVARALDAPFASETKTADYQRALAEERATDASDAENRGGYRLTGQIAGGLAGGVGLARNGLSVAANAANRGGGLARVSGASAADGALLGGAHGFGSGEGLSGRMSSAAMGGAVGLGMGAVAPAAVTGVSRIAKGAVAPFVAPFKPEPYARDAIATAVRRSGRSPQEITGRMRLAAEEGQPMYNVADAMGNAGQRLMAAVARTPNEARQTVAEALQRRQSGQGERLAQFISEGMGSADTAAQRSASLTNARTGEANRLYAAARRDAGPVNVTPVIEAIDETLSPGVNQIANPRDKIAFDSIEGALSRVRSMITDGRSHVTDFNVLFRTKLDLDDMIQRAEAQGAGNRAHYLANVQRKIDDALSEASPSYATARDAFSRASRRIEAVDAGKASFRPSHRADDTIAAFTAMSPEEQIAFRAGYADPAVARVEGMSMSPTTNKARVLQSPKLEQELKAFAAPGEKERLGRRIGREQRMFETAAAALGGSKTADNLADIADLQQFDPGVMSALLRQDYVGALTNGVAKALNTAQGMPPSVSDRVARALINTNPDEALQLLERGTKKLSDVDRWRSRVAAALVSSGAAGAGRL